MNNNPYNFFILNIQQIADGGLAVLYRKFRRIFFSCPAILAVLVIRAIKPFVHIRFGTFEANRIGHFAMDAGILLAERELTKSSFSDWYWLPTLPPTCNEQFERMVRRVFYVRWWVRYLDFVNSIIPGGKMHQVLRPQQSQLSRDVHGFLFKAKDIPESYLPFSPDEKSAAEDFLTELGWKRGERFVCLIVRDSAYLNTEPLFKRGNWDYHNYRNSDIDTYKEAALALAEKGYWVFRMGKHMHHPFCCNHPRVIDYAFNDNKSDFLDIWLTARCFFCVSTGTGLDSVATIFRRPIVHLNFLPLTHFTSFVSCICVPKHLIWKNTREYLSLQQHLDLEINYIQSSDCEESEIDVVDLSSVEIKDAVLEMEERLAGTWMENPEDTDLQNNFMKEYKEWPGFSKLHNFIHSDFRMGAHFLRNNREWLR